MKRLLIEAVDNLDIDPEIRASIRASAHEDNQGAYFLANNQRITTRTRWYQNRYHWFWEHVSKDGVSGDSVAVVECDTALQDADYMTKALAPEPFEANRYRTRMVTPFLPFVRLRPRLGSLPELVQPVEVYPCIFSRMSHQEKRQ